MRAVRLSLPARDACQQCRWAAAPAQAQCRQQFWPLPACSTVLSKQSRPQCAAACPAALSQQDTQCSAPPSRLPAVQLPPYQPLKVDRRSRPNAGVLHERRQRRSGAVSGTVVRPAHTSCCSWSRAAVTLARSESLSCAGLLQADAGALWLLPRLCCGLLPWPVGQVPPPPAAALLRGALNSLSLYITTSTGRVFRGIYCCTCSMQGNLPWPLG